MTSKKTHQTNKQKRSEFSRSWKSSGGLGWGREGMGGGQSISLTLNNNNLAVSFLPFNSVLYILSQNVGSRLNFNSLYIHLIKHNVIKHNVSCEKEWERGCAGPTAPPPPNYWDDVRHVRSFLKMGGGSGVQIHPRKSLQTKKI